MTPGEPQGYEWSGDWSSPARGSSVETLSNTGNETLPNVTELSPGARRCVKLCGKQSGE